MTHAEKLALFESHIPFIHFMFNKLCKKFTYIEHDDLKQLCYLAFWKCLDLWNPEKGELTTYSSMSMHNALKNYIYHQTRDGTRYNKDNIPIHALSQYMEDHVTDPPYRKLISNDLFSIVNTLAEGRDNDILKSYFIKGIDPMELATKYKLSRQSISLIIKKAKMKLRRKYKEYYGCDPY